MYKIGSLLENEMKIILWYFEIKTNHQILARRRDVVLKKNLSSTGLWRSGRPQSKNKRQKKKRQIHVPFLRAKKQTVAHEWQWYQLVSLEWFTKILKNTGKFENPSSNQDHSTVKIN